MDGKRLMTQIEIASAKPEEAATLKGIALAAKGHWQYPADLMAQWAQTPIIRAEDIAADIVFTARADSVLAGWYRLQDHPPMMVLEDLWIQPEFIGKGIGRILFNHAVEQARTHNAQFMELDADPNALQFYIKMGCMVIGETVSEWGRMLPRLRFVLNR